MFTDCSFALRIVETSPKVELFPIHINICSRQYVLFVLLPGVSVFNPSVLFHLLDTPTCFQFIKSLFTLKVTFVVHAPNSILHFLGSLATHMTSVKQIR